MATILLCREGMKKSMDKGKLTNKNSTFEEFKNAVKELIVNENSCSIEEAERLISEDGETLKKHYIKGYCAGDEAWGLSLLAE